MHFCLVSGCSQFVIQIENLKGKPAGSDKGQR